MCLDAASPKGPVKIVRCHGMGGNQAWVYNDEVKRENKRSLFRVLSICTNARRVSFFFRLK